jgi:hypothetical protein
VRDDAGELADRLEALRLAELFLGPFMLGGIGGDADHAVDGAAGVPPRSSPNRYVDQRVIFALAAGLEAVQRRSAG